MNLLLGPTVNAARPSGACAPAQANSRDARCAADHISESVPSRTSAEPLQSRPGVGPVQPLQCQDDSRQPTPSASPRADPCRRGLDRISRPWRVLQLSAGEFPGKVGCDATLQALFTIRWRQGLSLDVFRTLGLADACESGQNLLQNN